MNAISTAREALQAQLEPIACEAAELKERLDTLGRSKAQLEAALKALAPSKKSKSKAARKAEKPCARKPDVLAVCLALVKENPKISQGELEELAKHKLAEDLGFSLSGVGLRLGECLSSESFAVAADGTVSIAQASSEKTSDKAESDLSHSIELPVERSSRSEKAG